MMEWASPLAFLLLPLVFLLPLQGRLTGQWHLRVAGAEDLSSGWSAVRLLAWIPMAARMIGLFALVLALARPRLVHREVVLDSEGLDIMIAVDTSGSMDAKDLVRRWGTTSRLDIAKRVIADFVDGRPYDRIGVVVFGEEAFTHIPLTLDHDTLAAVLSHVEVGMAGAQGTAVGSALAVAAKRMNELDAPSKIVILITDGQSNAGRISPEQAAQAAAALDIRVYTIGVGGSGGGFFRLLGEGIDEATLRMIADTTGGKYYPAADSKALERVFASIDEMEPSPAEVEELVHHTELYRSFLGPSLLLLLLDLLLSGTVFRRWP
jgi:Ca-activated chloride channel family protein